MLHYIGSYLNGLKVTSPFSTKTNPTYPLLVNRRGHEQILGRPQNLRLRKLTLKLCTLQDGDGHTTVLQCVRLSLAEVNARLKEHEIGLGGRGLPKQKLGSGTV